MYWFILATVESLFYAQIAVIKKLANIQNVTYVL